MVKPFWLELAVIWTSYTILIAVGATDWLNSHRRKKRMLQRIKRAKRGNAHRAGI